MNSYVKDRALLPVAIPLGVIVFIGLVAISMSKILLNVPKEIATAVALMVAFNILVVCAVVAARPSLGMTEAVPMLGVAVVPVLIGLAVAGGLVEISGGEEHGEAAEGAYKVAISAQNLAFDTKELKVPAAKPFEIEFTNNEAALHNVVIQKDQSSTEPIFKKPFFAGPKTVTWEVEPLEAGTYYFKCEVHPAMNGSVLAEEVADSGKEHAEKAKATKVSVSARDLKFNKTVLTIPAEVEFDLEFDNQEPQPHNVTILKAKGSTEALFKERFFAGPKKVSWKVPAIPAGQYYFQCDVHPAMNGSVTAA